MTPNQVELVQQSFAKVAPIADKAAALFYGRLFEIAPDVKPLFQTDMAEQGRKLMGTLAVVVAALTKLDTILPAASALAKRHVGYGVKAAHYTPVGARRCCGRWSRASGLPGRPNSRRPGPRPTRRCPAT